MPRCNSSDVVAEEVQLQLSCCSRTLEYSAAQCRCSHLARPVTGSRGESSQQTTGNENNQEQLQSWSHYSSLQPSRCCQLGSTLAWPPQPVITTVTCTPPTVTPVLVLYQPCFGFHPTPALRLLVRSFPDSSSPVSDNVGLLASLHSSALCTTISTLKCN